MSRRAVSYARVSSDDTRKEGRNLESQLTMCREFAQTKGWTIVAELAEDDRGASGAALDLPKLNQILSMARASQIDVVIVREIDRFSRKLAKQLVVEEELRRCGVEVEYVLGEYPDTPEGNLNKNIKAVIAEAEISEGLQELEQDFAYRRWVIERLNVTARLVIEDGEQILYVKSLVNLQPKQFSLKSSSSATRTTRIRR